MSEVGEGLIDKVVASVKKWLRDHGDYALDKQDMAVLLRDVREILGREGSAETIDRLTRERDEAQAEAVGNDGAVLRALMAGFMRQKERAERAEKERDQLAQALTEANRAVEKIAKERDEARAAAIERCIAEIGIQKSAAANPGSFMYSVLSSAQSKLRALIDKQAPTNE